VNNYLKTFFAGLILLSALWVQAADPFSITWPEVPVPPKAKVESVSEHMYYNGLPMRVQHFKSLASVPELLAYYRGHWGSGALKPVENTVGAWQTIGMPSGPFYMTVQVKPAASGGGSEGLIGVSALNAKVEIPKVDDFAKLGGTQVVSVVESKDVGKSNKQLVLVNSHTVSANAGFYDTSFEHAGWKRLQDNRISGHKIANSGYFAIYQKGKEQIDLAIGRMPNGLTTSIMANLIKSD
jgi:hypothetical protein